MSNTPDLKGSSFTLSVLHLPDNDIQNSIVFLKDKVSQAPAFFTSAPVVINISQLDRDIDFNMLKQGVLEAGMVPVGITGTKSKRLQQLATAAGFAFLNTSNSTVVNSTVCAPTVAQEKTPIKVIHTPIRSGQQIYAKDGDLLILNHVSAGAEIIADGSIHIHGSLRGRAIAGASGDLNAKIICNDLQAELVSIAGNYWLSDQIASEYWQKKIMVSMNDDDLQIEILTI
jgi:septum site-determining protein MinC